MAKIGELEGIGLDFEIWGFLEENSEKGYTRKHTGNWVAR
jgi:hypothetical protein